MRSSFSMTPQTASSWGRCPTPTPSNVRGGAQHRPIQATDPARCPAPARPPSDPRPTPNAKSQPPSTCAGPAACNAHVGVARTYQEQSFFEPIARDHGGAHSIKRRRTRRPLSTRHAIHFTLKSDLAGGARSLRPFEKQIEMIAEKAAKRFGIRIYRRAICATHLHYLIRGTTRTGLQNFFRVFAGHVAQMILKNVPLSSKEERKRAGCKKNHRRFWSLLLYSRVVTWGREFKGVANYVLKNQLEALNIIAYTPRARAAPA